MKPLFKILPVVVLALILGGLAMWSGACSVYEGYVNSTWPQATGTIQESRIGNPNSSGRGNIAPFIEYTYTVEGRSYHGSRIDTRGAWNFDTGLQVVDAYPSGSQRPVFYSPSAPGNSILIRGIHRGSFFGLGLGTIILSIGALFGTMAYLASIYGTYTGRRYTFDDDSPAVPVAIFGIIAILCQFGLLFWIAQ
jgi:Protein of unknown function (DUF3592)